MKKKPSKIILILTVIVVNVGCNNRSSQFDAVPAKSLAYYMEHAQEAKEVANRCLTFESNELSTMSPSSRKAWEESAAGVNCNNAKSGAVSAINKEYQDRLRKSAESLR